ncbi:MAG: alkaline phosphatase D family protein [Microthrixaceae bacterium]
MVEGVAVVAGDSRGMSRRELFAALAVAGAVPLVASACAPGPGAAPTPPPPGSPEAGIFPDGVKAGDPAPDGAVIWTRVLPPAGGGQQELTWMVGDGPDLDVIRAGGVVTASAATGHTVALRVAGLEPDRWYWYRFETPTGASRVGRLRTAPAADKSPDHLRFAFASCQQINDHCWFVAHRRIAEEGVDFLMHLGDYIYVSDTGTQTLDQYRDRYRRWHQQRLLRDLHAQVPIVAMWDDGEFVNGVDKTMPEPRFSNAKQAWYENQPVLDSGDRQPQRAFSWGTLADIFMIDVRAHRDPPVMESAWDPTRSTLGAEQYDWFTSGLASSTAAWRVIGNPYNINPWKLLDLEWLRGLDPSLPPDAGVYAPNEAWDNYRAERRDLLRFLGDRGIDNTMFCSAHTHIAMASDLRADSTSPVTATDVVAGSLTADPDVRHAYFSELPPEAAEQLIRVGEQWIVGQNPEMRYLNLIDQGWVTVDVTPEETTFAVRAVDTAHENAEARTIASFRVTSGKAGLNITSTSSSGTFG